MQKPFHGAVGPRIPGKLKEITFLPKKKIKWINFMSHKKQVWKKWIQIELAGRKERKLWIFQSSAYIQSITTKWYPIITSLSNDPFSYINTFTINNINCFIYAERGTLYIALIISWLVIIQVYWKWFCHAYELSVSCLTQIKENKKNGKVLYTIIPSSFLLNKKSIFQPLVF